MNLKGERKVSIFTERGNCRGYYYPSKDVFDPGQRTLAAGFCGLYLVDMKVSLPFTGYAKLPHLLKS